MLIAFTLGDNFGPFNLKIFYFTLSRLDSDFIRKTKLGTKLRCSLNVFNYVHYSEPKADTPSI